jgi:hypothetical protein
VIFKRLFCSHLDEDVITTYDEEYNNTEILFKCKKCSKLRHIILGGKIQPIKTEEGVTWQRKE